jgi:hypothetical protein
MALSLTSLLCGLLELGKDDPPPSVSTQQATTITVHRGQQDHQLGLVYQSPAPRIRPGRCRERKRISPGPSFASSAECNFSRAADVHALRGRRNIHREGDITRPATKGLLQGLQQAYPASRTADSANPPSHNPSRQGPPWSFRHRYNRV